VILGYVLLALITRAREAAGVRLRSGLLVQKAWTQLVPVGLPEIPPQP
jgi:hypothetical protein